MRYVEKFFSLHGSSPIFDTPIQFPFESFGVSTCPSHDIQFNEFILSGHDIEPGRLNLQIPRRQNNKHVGIVR